MIGEPEAVELSVPPSTALSSEQPAGVAAKGEIKPAQENFTPVERDPAKDVQIKRLAEALQQISGSPQTPERQQKVSKQITVENMTKPTGIFQISKLLFKIINIVTLGIAGRIKNYLLQGKPTSSSLPA